MTGPTASATRVQTADAAAGRISAGTALRTTSSRDLPGGSLRARLTLAADGQLDPLGVEAHEAGDALGSVAADQPQPAVPASAGCPATALGTARTDFLGDAHNHSGR